MDNDTRVVCEWLALGPESAAELRVGKSSQLAALAAALPGPVPQEWMCWAAAASSHSETFSFDYVNEQGTVCRENYCQTGQQRVQEEF